MQRYGDRYFNLTTRLRNKILNGIELSERRGWDDAFSSTPRMCFSLLFQSENQIACGEGDEGHEITWNNIP